MSCIEFVTVTAADACHDYVSSLQKVLHVSGIAVSINIEIQV